MNPHPDSRGMSILATLVVIGVLGAAVATNISAYGGAQAASASLAGTRNPPMFCPGASSRTACEQTGVAKDGDLLTQECTPGFHFKLIEDKGKVDVLPTPLSQYKNCPSNALITAQPQLAAAGALAADLKTVSCAPGDWVYAYVPNNVRAKCSIEYCRTIGIKNAGGSVVQKPTCVKVDDVSSGQSLGDVGSELSKRALNDLVKGLTPQQRANIDTSGFDTPDKAFLSSQLAKDQLETEDMRQEAALEAGGARQQYEQAIKDLANKCKDDSECIESDTSVAEARKKLEKEELRLKQLEEQRQELAQAQKALSAAASAKNAPPSSTTMEPYDSEKAADPAYGCDSGLNVCWKKETTAAPPPKVETSPEAELLKKICALRPEICTGRDNTFPNQQNPGGQFPGLPQMPGGKGSPPPAGNKTPQAAGTCQPQMICSGSALMSRNNQCVDTLVQQCQYGCSANACVQQGQNCPAAPQQPDPSGCQGGSWRPTYSGACVNGWQCVSGSGSGLTAQISCQPQVADVGMSVAISYSCSAGTSEGAGFQTNGAQSGSVAVTVATPPANTNTATYGIKCTSVSQSATQQCSIQVGKPSIIFVANPKVVKPSEQSTLGWITSGMSSCVISSPDIPAFTEQHKGNTNANGSVVTPALTADASFLLKCVTVGGAEKNATSTIEVKS